MTKSLRSFALCCVIALAGAFASSANAQCTCTLVHACGPLQSEPEKCCESVCPWSWIAYPTYMSISHTCPTGATNPEERTRANNTSAIWREGVCDIFTCLCAYGPLQYQACPETESFAIGGEYCP